MGQPDIQNSLGKQLHAGQRPAYERYGVVVVVLLLLVLPAFLDSGYLKLLPLLIAGLLACTGLVAGVVWLVGRRNLKLVALHEHGMLVRGRHGAQAVPWSEVKSVIESTRRVNGAELNFYDVNFGESVRISAASLGDDKTSELLSCITENAGLEWDESGRIAASADSLRHVEQIRAA